MRGDLYTRAMSKTRILHFVWRLSSSGGIPRVVRHLLKGTSREQFEIHVCTVRPLFPEDHVEELGVGLVFHPLNLLGEPTSVRILLEFARVARKVRPDVLHTHDGIAWYTVPPRFLGCGTRGKILEVHDAPQTRRRARLNGAMGSWMVKRLGYQPLVHSSSVLRGVAEAYGISSDAIALIHLGVETAHFRRPRVSRTDWRQRMAIPLDTLLVLYVARLVPRKNVNLYVDVARTVIERIDKALFMIVGDGPLKRTLEGSVRGSSLERKIRFLGGFSDDLVDVYHACDLFLSTSNYEGFGLAIVEAMAAGKPVVATSVGGVPEVVLDGSTGRLCAPEDVSGLARAVLELLGDGRTREQMGRAAQERASELFDVRDMLKKYEELYISLAHGQGNGKPSA